MSYLVPLAFFATIIALVYLSFSKPRFRIRHGVYLGVGTIALVALGFDAYDITTHGYPEWQVTTFLGSIIIALGWVVSNEISLNNSRKQHTISLLTNLMNNERRIQDKAIINAKLPPYGPPIKADIADYEKSTDPFIQAIDRELNFYEFIAVGLDSGDLDPIISKRFLEVLVPDFVEQMTDYIQFWQRKDPRIWKYVIELSRTWST